MIFVGKIIRWSC